MRSHFHLQNTGHNFLGVIAIAFLLAFARQSIAANWLLRRPADGTSLAGVTRGRDHFVAVGARGAVLKSATGTQWETVPKFTDDDLLGAAWDGNAFWAVSSFNLFSSGDGVTWTTRPSPTGNQQFGIAFGNGVFVVPQHRTNNTRVGISLLVSTPDWTSFSETIITQDPLSNEFGPLKFEDGFFQIAYRSYFSSGVWGGGLSNRFSKDGIRWGADRGVNLSSGGPFDAQISSASLFRFPGRPRALAWGRRLAIYHGYSGYSLQLESLWGELREFYSDFLNGQQPLLVISQPSYPDPFWVFTEDKLYSIQDPIWEENIFETVPIMTPIPKGNWFRAFRWTGIQNRAQPAFQLISPVIVLGSGGAIMQFIFDHPAFIEPPRLSANGRLKLTVNLPPGHAVELISSDSPHLIPAENLETLHTFPAGAGEVIDHEIEISASQRFYLLKEL